MGERRILGVRQFLREVNLKDFFNMVLAELRLVGASLRLALHSGNPLLVLRALLLALIRVVLLVLVVVGFGTAIVVIAAIRRVVAITRRPA